MCGPAKFISDFMTAASDRDMIDGPTGEYMYLSVRTVNTDTLHPWFAGDDHTASSATLKAFRNLMQVTMRRFPLCFCNVCYHSSASSQYPLLICCQFFSPANHLLLENHRSLI